jgi:hypothetical protein
MDQSNDGTVDILYTQFRDEIKKEILKVYSFFKASSSKLKKEAIKVATGDYILFIYSYDKIAKNFIYQISNISEAINADILEFNVKHIGKVDVQNNQLNDLEPNKMHNVQSNLAILGQASPFIYTKLFKRRFLEDNIDLFKLDSYYDSYYSYILLSLAKTFYFVNIKGLVIKIKAAKNDHETLIKQ